MSSEKSKEEKTNGDQAQEAPPVRRLYLDRIEGEVAVLLRTEGDEEVEEHVSRSSLPEAAREGDWLIEQHAGEDGPRHFALDREETDAAKARVQSLMDELESMSS